MQNVLCNPQALPQQKFKTVRYNSLLADASKLPKCLRVTATSAVSQSVQAASGHSAAMTCVVQTGEIMGLCHRERPLHGVQFHPESVCTEHGRAMAENFRAIVAEFWKAKRTAAASSAASSAGVAGDAAATSAGAAGGTAAARESASEAIIAGFTASASLERKDGADAVRIESRGDSKSSAAGSAASGPAAAAAESPFVLLVERVPAAHGLIDPERAFSKVTGGCSLAFWLDSSRVRAQDECHALVLLIDCCHIGLIAIDSSQQPVLVHGDGSAEPAFGAAALLVEEPQALAANAHQGAEICQGLGLI